MTKLRIGCDMDGIVVDLLGLWLKEIHETHGVLACADEVNFWDMSMCEKLKHLGSDTLVDFLRRPGFYERAAPVAGACMNLSYLSAMGHHITMVTATPGRWGPEVDKDVQAQKKRWLQRWLSHHDVKNVIFPSAAEKVHHKFDVFIDDRAETLEAYAKAHPEALVCGIEYPYNRHVPAARVLLARDHNDTITAWNTITNAIELHAGKRHA